MNEVKEKDNFWLIVGGVIVVAIAVMFTIKSSGHNDYEKSARAIAEDSSNSSYHR